MVEVVPAPEAQMLVLPLTDGAEGFASIVKALGVACVAEHPLAVLVTVTL